MEGAVGMSEVFPVGDPVEHDLRIARLATSRSLINPARRQSRNDVLISSIAAVLATRQDLTASRLFEAVRRMWQTDALADAVLETALLDARSAGIIVQHTDLDGNERYRISDPSAAETEEDQNYVSHLMSQFIGELSDRILDYPDAVKLIDRIDRISSHVVTAIAHACEGSYVVDPVVTSPWTRPISVKVDRVLAYASTLEPTSVGTAVRELALDALDPADPFGNQIVHLVLIGSLLHALAAQRSIEASPSLTHLRLLLDTSALVGLARPENDPEHQLILTLITLSIRCDAQVVVAEHTLDEWNRVWEAAELQVAGNEQWLEQDMSTFLTRSLNNPFLAAYVDFRRCGGHDRWDQWRDSRCNIRGRLETLGARIERFDPVDPTDVECYDAVNAKLMELSDSRDVWATRTRAAAAADARSATLIARWRREDGADSAIFLARESLTNRAFSEAFIDEAPLVGDPDAWLLYVSNLIVDDETRTVEIADLVADLAVRDAVLGLASSHTLEEAAEISTILQGGDMELSAHDSRDLNELRLFDSLDMLQREVQEDARVRAATILSRRAARSNRRAANREALLDKEVASIRAEAADRIREEAERASRNEEAKESERIRADNAEQTVDRVQDENVSLRRKLSAGLASAPVALIFIVLISWGFLSVRGVGVTLLVLALGATYSYRWINYPEESTLRLWLNTMGQILLATILAILL